jgi:Flp pilus assembly protein TadG
MLPRQSPFRIFFRKFDRELMGLRADRRGNIAVMMAFLLPVIVGFLGLGFEVSDWYLQTRYMQNAADSAAVAAATAAIMNTNSSTYAAEAKAVTAKYGFVDGTNNVTVTPSTSPPAGITAPTACSGINTCYYVQITSMVPLWLSQVIGYAGDTTLNGVKEKILSSVAVAESAAPNLCLLALDTKGTAFTANGSPKTDFTGCTIMSNSNATCNGSNLNATEGIAVGTNGGGAGCGKVQSENSATPDTTPGCETGRCYSSILANADGGQMSNDALALCNNKYPKAQNGVYSTNLSALSQLPSFTGSDGTVYYVACGDTQLSGTNATITGPSNPPPKGTPGYVLVVENGNLDFGNNNTLSGSALTVVFSGDKNAANYGHALTVSNGTTGSILDIQAPTSGDWSGVALYQDPKIPSGTGVNMTYAGNNPTWDITGLVYLPNSSLTISGVVNKSSNGAVCMVTVAKDVLVNGTGTIYAQTPDGSGCKLAGLNQPKVMLARAQLVY